MKANDPVELMFVLNYWYAPSCPMTRQTASDFIREWWQWRERCAKMRWFRRAWLRLRGLFQTWTLAHNYPDETNPTQTYALFAVDMQSVRAMYIREVTPSIQERTMLAQEMIAKAMAGNTNYEERVVRAHEKIAEAVERETKVGDEWKDGEQE